jgi:hypothetical protein
MSPSTEPSQIAVVRGVGSSLLENRSSTHFTTENSSAMPCGLACLLPTPLVGTHHSLCRLLYLRKRVNELELEMESDLLNWKNTWAVHRLNGRSSCSSGCGGSSQAQKCKASAECRKDSPTDATDSGVRHARRVGTSSNRVMISFACAQQRVNPLPTSRRT